jgi:hypothetical protein
VRPGIMQPHPAATTATNSNTLQQCSAPPRHPLAVCVIAIEIVREPLLVRHELLPIDISRKCVLQANRPILYRHGFRRASLRTRAAADWPAPASAINISPCISRVLQNLKDARVARRLPDDVMGRWPGERPHRQQQVGFLKMAHHRLGAAKLAKLGEQMQQPRLHLLIGIEGNPAISAMDQARRQRQSQLASRRLLALALEAAAAVVGRTGLPKVVINDLNPFLGPTKRSCSIDQPVLQLRALLTLADLSWEAELVYEEQRGNQKGPDPLKTLMENYHLSRDAARDKLGRLRADMARSVRDLFTSLVLNADQEITVTINPLGPSQATTVLVMPDAEAEQAPTYDPWELADECREIFDQQEGDKILLATLTKKLNEREYRPWLKRGKYRLPAILKTSFDMDLLYLYGGRGYRRCQFSEEALMNANKQYRVGAGRWPRGASERPKPGEWITNPDGISLRRANWKNWW